MSQFTYKARTPEGEIREGVIDVVNRDLAIDLLQKSNLIVLQLDEAEREKKDLLTRFLGPRKIKSRDIAIFSRQLSTLFDAQVPVTRALKTLVAEATDEHMKYAFNQILEDVSGGTSLSLAMSKHPNAFSYFYVNMVKAAEESGKLREVFNYLADYLERSHDITSKIRNALIYPAFVFTAFIAVMIVMLVVVVPRMVSIFQESGAPVPFYTQTVFAAAFFLRRFGVFLLVALIGAVIGLFQYIKTPRGKEFFDKFKLKVPIFGNLFKKFYLSRFADNLSSLINAGVPILRALQVVASVIDNKVYENVVLDAARAVKSGNTIGFALSQYEQVPPLLTQMVRIGEESGRLESILESVARFYKRDVDNLVVNIVSLIEPAMIVLLGGGVGLLVASILVPLYSLTSTFA